LLARTAKTPRRENAQTSDFDVNGEESGSEVAILAALSAYCNATTVLRCGIERQAN
jgi:hypothetical protein